MTKPKVYITRRLPDPAMERIHSYCEAQTWDEELPPPKEEIIRNVTEADGLLTLLTDQIDAELIDGAPKLKVISNLAVGFDNIDVETATKRGILVTNTPGVLTETTADFAFALMMAAARRVVEGDRFVRSGKWKTWGPMLLLGQDLHGSTLGIIGLGRIGEAVARRAKGFGMKILYYDAIRQPQKEKELGIGFAEFDRILVESDFITLHANLTPQTYHLIGTHQLKKMKKNCVLVNTSRGPMVDNMALYEALKSRTIAYAALDVTEPEPIPAGHPLLELDNVIVSPHIASASVTTRTKMALMAANNLMAGLAGGVPPNLVNPEVLKERRQ